MGICGLQQNVEARYRSSILDVGFANLPTRPRLRVHSDVLQRSLSTVGQRFCGVFAREKVSGIVARQRWMCFRTRGNCVVPLATVANAEPRNAQQWGHKHGYEEDHHRDQDCPRQERFGKEAGRQKAARPEDRQGNHGKQTGRHQNDRQKDVSDRRGLGGFEEGPQTHVLQRDG